MPQVPLAFLHCETQSIGMETNRSIQYGPNHIYIGLTLCYLIIFYTPRVRIVLVVRRIRRFPRKIIDHTLGAIVTPSLGLGLGSGSEVEKLIF